MGNLTESDLESPASTGGHVLILVGILIVLEVVCVGLRYLSRYLSRAPWGVEDSLILAAFICQMATNGAAIAAVKHAGVGHHMVYLQKTSRHTLLIWGRYYVAFTVIYFACANLPKLAILALFFRVFPQPMMRKVLYLLATFIIVHSTATAVAALLACKPISATWDASVVGAQCINRGALLQWGGFPNIVSDLAILVAPIPVVCRLQMSIRLKIGLILTLLSGGMGLITSTVRFAVLNGGNQELHENSVGAHLIMLSQAEMGIYLISACLMTYRPLLERIGWIRTTEKPLWASSRSTLKSGGEKGVKSFDNTKAKWVGDGGAASNWKSYKAENRSLEMPLRSYAIGERASSQHLTGSAEDGDDSDIRVTTKIMVV